MGYLEKTVRTQSQHCPMFKCPQSIACFPIDWGHLNIASPFCSRRRGSIRVLITFRVKSLEFGIFPANRKTLGSMVGIPHSRMLYMVIIDVRPLIRGIIESLPHSLPRNPGVTHGSFRDYVTRQTSAAADCRSNRDDIP